MANDQNPKDEMVLPPEHPDLTDVLKNSPLKIRWERGVMKVTPFIPLILRGTLEEGGVFGI
jgi:hypothetical protein